MLTEGTAVVGAALAGVVAWAAEAAVDGAALVGVVVAAGDADPEEAGAEDAADDAADDSEAADGDADGLADSLTDVVLLAAPDEVAWVDEVVAEDVEVTEDEEDSDVVDVVEVVESPAEGAPLVDGARTGASSAAEGATV